MSEMDFNLRFQKKGMGKDQLQKKEMATLYWVQERQQVIELDSPAPGAEQTIAFRNKVYEFFHSEEQAKEFVEGIKGGYKEKNSGLKESKYGLEGQVPHPYSHVYEISFLVKSDLVDSEIGDDIVDLLERPKSRTIGEKLVFERYSYLRPDEKPYHFELL